jgi:hypothetical protein
MKLDQSALIGRIVPFMEKISALLFRAVQNMAKYGYSVTMQTTITTR